MVCGNGQAFILRGDLGPARLTCRGCAVAAQAAWGDWKDLHATRFPGNNLKHITERISAAGFTPGLWMAPLTADLDSTLAAEHPDWILRQGPSLKDAAVNSGYTHPGKWFYALDVTHPAVQAHLHDIIHTAVHEWVRAFPARRERR